MKKSEKRLLTALIAMLFIGLVVVGLDIYLKKRTQLRADRDTLDQEWVIIETLFEERETWEARAKWLDLNQPAVADPGKMSQAIFEESSAEGAKGVTTSGQTLLDTKTTPHYTEVGVALTAKGKLPDVFRWLHDLTDPKEFRVIRNIQVVPDKDDSEAISAKFDLLRWHAPKKGE